MLNNQFYDNEKNYRDPAAILAEAAAELASMPKDDSTLERVGDARVIKDPKLNEEIIMDLAFGALCESRGIEESPDDFISWSLYCQGALEPVAFWYCLEDEFLASFAWPEERVALMLAPRLSRLAEMSAELIAARALEDGAVEAAFRRQGWIVLRINPDSSTIELELERIVALVRALKADGARAA